MAVVKRLNAAVRWLFEKGADVSMQSRYYYNALQVAPMLLDKGAKSTRNTDTTAMHPRQLQSIAIIQ